MLDPISGLEIPDAPSSMALPALQNPYVGTSGTGIYVPPGGTQAYDIASGQPVKNGLTTPSKNVASASPSDNWQLGNFIKHFEGSALRSYTDVPGIQAIGYGHDITPEEHRQGYIDTPSGRVPLGGTITPEQQDAIWQRDWNEHKNAVANVVPEFDKLNENQQEALISYNYNVGHLPSGVSEAIASGNMQAVADALRNGVNTGRGIGYMPQLAARRAAEADLFLLPEGQHPDLAKPSTNVAGMAIGKPMGSHDFNGVLNNSLTVLNKPQPLSNAEEVSPIEGEMSPWMKLMSLSMIRQLTQAGTHQFTPVSYDPWKYVPQQQAASEGYVTRTGMRSQYSDG